MTTENDSGKQYHKSCTGDALDTVKKHSTPQGITFFGACFCPFVQRVWVALEYLDISYYVNEVDPYKKPAELLEVSPKGLVPGLRIGDFSPARSLNESTVILEFIEDSADNDTGKSLLPPKSDAYARALVRLQCDQINRTLVPAFYRFLQSQDEKSVVSGAKDFAESLHGLTSLLQRAEREVGSTACGLWSESGELSLTDVMVGPWLFRATNVLKHYRGFVVPQGERFRSWLERLFMHPAFKSTCSTENLYLDSYERYAFNRPNTSQVANAINSGRGLP
ncbi:glutathione S-transferase [Phellopilus nigrolimitatus]|nr:glutathione S-transferase [Phellopilus nigrolimitatus]